MNQATDSTAMLIADIESAMNDTSSPINKYFHEKFASVTKDMKFSSEQARQITKQVCYLFYLQGLVHTRNVAAN